MMTGIALGVCFGVFINLFVYVSLNDTIAQMKKDMERKALGKIGGSYE